MDERCSTPGCKQPLWHGGLCDSHAVTTTRGGSRGAVSYAEPRGYAGLRGDASLRLPAVRSDTDAIPADEYAHKKARTEMKVTQSPLRFSGVGPGIKCEDGLSVSKTDRGYAFTLAAPAMRRGSASASFRLGYAPNDGEWGCAVGVFPADMELDSYIYATEGKRCALLLRGKGASSVACDGVESDSASGLEWGEGDQINVDVTFGAQGNTARVTLRAKGKTWRKTLQRVPACGVCVGVGLYD